jgi:radical SAM protein with 4Fe4S-binding SPASM domain
MRTVDLSRGEQVRLFNGLAIEIASKCNRTCYFCPNGYNQREDVFMLEETVSRLLEELSRLKYSGRIEWYIYNEPTRDERLKMFIRWARVQVPRACQMINTNGDYFKDKFDIAALFFAGLNQMQINIYSAQDNAENDKTFENGVAQARKREAQLQSWVDKISPTMNIHSDASLYLNSGPRKRICKVVAKYGVRPSFKDSDLEGPNHFSNRSGNIPGFRNGLTEPLKKMCVRPFRFLNIDYQGDALLCCNDYHGVVKIGNVKDHTLVELWNSSVLNRYRVKLQGHDRNSALCDKCDYNGGHYQHQVGHVTTGSAEQDVEWVQEPFYPGGLVQIAPKTDKRLI